ncbi:ABC transporter C family member 14 [Dorcoceras hygrometricum]|uniref:ABC transporter C family member 14 n=1 Tax=Dorcoceras hygrometricum TaxID=472368 RepID=A0A2Z7D322_9LAMI|nr:ABC transporter C family member 14 [Dorcoceras hygrometricum]
MGSNPSTESNNTTEITARNKMQVLCMRRQGTKESSTHKGAKELKHSSKNHRGHTLATDCGSLRQSGPRPDPRFLRQAALEALTRSVRTDSPQKTRPERFLQKRRTAAGGARWRIQLAVGPQPLWLRNHNSGLAHRIMVKRLATSPHDPLGITDSACKNQSVVVSVQYGPFNPYIPIRSTTIGKSRVAIDPIAMHTSWRSNSDITNVTSIGYPRMSASGESSTTMHRLLHASGSHPIPTPYDPKTNQYNQDLGLIHSTNGNHLESPKEGSSIDHQVTIYLHAQNITMFPTNETWYFASHVRVDAQLANLWRVGFIDSCTNDLYI